MGTTAVRFIVHGSRLHAREADRICTGGGQQLKAFRRGQGNYNPTKGKFRNDRGGCKGVFQGGETFKVVFDISMFDMNNAADAAIVNS